jgi:glucose-6-phosphate 1-epimerase
MRFEEALHAYFKVGDVRSARVKGLETVHYLDKTDRNHEKIQQGDVVITSETDRVYLDTLNPVKLSDPVLRRNIAIEKKDSRTTVLWNPWSEKAKAMVDLGANAWTQMLCIETSNVLTYAVELASGDCHRVSCVITTLGNAQNSSNLPSGPAD